MTQFGGRQDVLGQSVLLDDEPHTDCRRDACRRSTSRLARRPSGRRFASLAELLEDRTNWCLQVVARLKDDVSLDQARAEMKGIAAQLA